MKTLEKKIKAVLEENKSNHYKYSYDEFLNDIQKQKEYIKNFQEINSYFKRKFACEKDHLDLIILKNRQLSIVLKHYFDESRKAEKDFLKNSYTYRVVNDFWKILLVISNNSATLKQLYLSGLDFQAKVLFRNTIETTELCICMLGDESFYDFLRHDINNPALLNRTIKFGTIKKTTSKIIKWIENLSSNNMPENLWDNYLEIRQELYEDSSRHVHSNFLNIMLSSHVAMIETAYLDNGDMMIMNIGGMLNSLSHRNIQDYIVYDSLSYMIIMILLIEKHHLPIGKLDQDINFTVLLSQLNWDLLSDLRSNLPDSKKHKRNRSK